MQIRKAIFSIAALILIGSHVPVTAQNTGRIETRTRLVSVFSELQNQWFDALKKKDPAALNRLLTPDHEVWTADHNGPIPREDWQNHAFAENLKSFRLSNMAVKALSDSVAVESFRVETTTSPNGKPSTQQYFVVNVWTNEKDGWRCTDSYVSPVSRQPSGNSGPVRPSGKE
jgi:ketosteroid isomerase-like protein